MIMRTWRGAVRTEDAAHYLEHQDSTGIREYRETPGNLGALVLRRPRGELIEVTTVSFWASMAAVKAFAGEDYERAKFYPGDDDLLAEKDLHADHFEIVSGDVDPALFQGG
jgi:heme-degrading monooxygenase HmoA